MEFLRWTIAVCIALPLVIVGGFLVLGGLVDHIDMLFYGVPAVAVGLWLWRVCTGESLTN